MDNKHPQEAGMGCCLMHPSSFHIHLLRLPLPWARILRKVGVSTYRDIYLYVTHARPDSWYSRRSHALLAGDVPPSDTMLLNMNAHSQPNQEISIAQHQHTYLITIS